MSATSPYWSIVGETKLREEEGFREPHNLKAPDTTITIWVGWTDTTLRFKCLGLPEWQFGLPEAQENDPVNYSTSEVCGTGRCSLQCATERRDERGSVGTVGSKTRYSDNRGNITYLLPKVSGYET